MEDVLKVIYDFDNYKTFLTDLQETKIVKKVDDKTSDVFYKVSVLVTSIEYTLRLTKTSNGLTWTHTEHGPFEYNRGGWTLEEKNGKVYGEYTVDCAFNVWVPSFARDYIVGSRLPATMEAFKNQVEKLKKK